MDHLVFLTYIPALLSGIYWITLIKDKANKGEATSTYFKFYLSYSLLILLSSIITYLVLNIYNSEEVLKALSVTVFFCSCPMIYFLGNLELKTPNLFF